MTNAQNSRNRFSNKWIILSYWLMIVALLLSSCSNATPTPPNVYRVGVLAGLDFAASITDAFKAKMTELGYVEGQNIRYDVQRANNDEAAYERILKQFVGDKVDLIFAFPALGAIKAKAITAGTGIPVVFAYSIIEGTGIVDSVAEPGGNITGVRNPGPDIMLKRLDLLLEMAPATKRIWLPYKRGYPTIKPLLSGLHPAVEELGITLVETPADNAAELQADLEARAKLDDVGFDAILILSEPLVVTPEAFVVVGKFAHERKIPIGGAIMSIEGHETLFGVNASFVDAGEQAATLADKILKGAPAGTLPVLSPGNYIEINYRFAQELGLTVPPGLLAQADKVIR